MKRTKRKNEREEKEKNILEKVIILKFVSIKNEQNMKRYI
jgi:hypothetical protein